MNLMQDTFEAVRPEMKLCTSFEEASAACEELENEYKPKIGESCLTVTSRNHCSLLDVVLLKCFAAHISHCNLLGIISDILAIENEILKGT
jgi:hypothetical protein